MTGRDETWADLARRHPGLSEEELLDLLDGFEDDAGYDHERERRSA